MKPEPVRAWELALFLVVFIAALIFVLRFSMAGH